MASINPYIHFNGNAEVAFNFYKSVFGGEFAAVIRFSEFSNPEQSFPDHEANKIMHIALPIGQDDVLMGSDVPEILGQVNENENRFKISVSATSKAEADTIYDKLSVGGQIEMPIGDSPWGSYFAMFRDQFGIEWMIDYDPRYEGKTKQ